MKITNQANISSPRFDVNLPATSVSHTTSYYKSSITLGEPALEDSFISSMLKMLWSPFVYLFRLLGFGGVTPEEIQKLAQEKGFIYFYHHNNPASEWLGNFYPCPVKINGFTFSCAEAAYQMRKFDGNPALQAKFVGLNGEQAFRLARKHAKDVRSDWGSVKVRVMADVLEAKFKQNPHLETLLLATGKAYLVEHNEVVGRDDFWSDNHDGTGQNQLGIAHMLLRKKLGGHGIVSAPATYHTFLKNS